MKIAISIIFLGIPGFILAHVALGILSDVLHLRYQNNILGFLIDATIFFSILLLTGFGVVLKEILQVKKTLSKKQPKIKKVILQKPIKSPF